MEEGLIVTINLQTAVLRGVPDNAGRLLTGQPLVQSRHPVRQARGIGGTVEEIAVQCRYERRGGVGLHRQVGEVHGVASLRLRNAHTDSPGSSKSGKTRWKQLANGVGSGRQPSELVQAVL